MASHLPTREDAIPADIDNHRPGWYELSDRTRDQHGNQKQSSAVQEDTITERQSMHSHSSVAEASEGQQRGTTFGAIGRRTEREVDTPRRRCGVWWIASLYPALVAVPWILTCLMNFRPVSGPGYFDHSGRLTPKAFEINQDVQVAVDFMFTLAALLTIPTTSNVLAQAVVVWLQRNDSDTRRPVSLAQSFDLADAGWTNLATVWREIVRKRSKDEVGGRNWFLLAASGFIIYCSAVLLLWQVLVGMEVLDVVTCRDIPHQPSDGRCGSSTALVVAQNQQPAVIEQLPLWTVKEQVSARLIGQSGLERQPSLWTNATDDLGVYITHGVENPQVQNSRILPHIRRSEHLRSDIPWWTSDVPNGTTTGVLRQRTMRLHSSVSWQSVEVDDIPDPCPGTRPFVAGYDWNSPPLTESKRNTMQLNYAARICVPGKFTQTPWSRSDDAVTIHEKIYLGINYRNTSESEPLGSAMVALLKPIAP